MIDPNIVVEYQQTKNQNLLPYIIKHTEHLVKKAAFALKKRNRHSSLEDLISCGYEGLMLALNKYDDKKSNNFELYALKWIYAKINFYILKNSSILNISGRTATKTFSNYSKISNCPTQEFNLIKNALQPTSSLFYNESLEEKLPSEYIFDLEKEQIKTEANDLYKKDILNFKDSLSSIELDIFNNRILNEEPKKLKQFAEKYHYSNQYIAILEKKIVNKFKKKILTSDNKDLYQSLL